MGARSRLDLLGLLLFGLTVAGAATLTFSLLVGFGPTADGLADRWLGPLVPALAGASILARCVGRAHERTAWLLVALALVVWAAGEGWYSIVLWDADPMPFPSFADALWLGFYPCAVAALLVLAHHRRGGEASRVSWLDAAIGSLGIAAAGAAVAFEPIVAATGGSVLAVATNLAYPLGDLLLVALVIGLMSPATIRIDRSWVALGLGFVVFGVTDTVYLFRIAEESYTVGTLLDAGWVLGAAVLASAAWLPVTRRRSPARGWSAFVLPCAFGALALGVLVYDHFQPVHLLALALAVACLVAVLGRMTLVFGENLAMLSASREDAVTDSLTGLWNRRKLLADLEQEGHGVLVLLDLDGFKSYNDTYGHLAGDSLLDRLGRGLAGIGTGAYRMGGDEFCVLGGQDVDAAVLAAEAASALHERGEGFEITCSYGFVALPQEAHNASSALRLADRRMYAQKQVRRASAGRQSKDVLISALGERNAALLDHVAAVAELAVDVGRHLGLAEHELEQLRHVAELHDVGKMAIPDAILQKEGVLGDEDWAFLHQHTLIGERIVGAAPALAVVARAVRSTHERWDGRGYPDGLCGAEIPLAARIVAVCDAVSAMISARPYRGAVDLPEALAELERCAGSQFDPAVVAAACAVLSGASAVAA